MNKQFQANFKDLICIYLEKNGITDSSKFDFVVDNNKNVITKWEYKDSTGKPINKPTTKQLREIYRLNKAE